MPADDPGPTPATPRERRRRRDDWFIHPEILLGSALHRQVSKADGTTPGERSRPDSHPEPAGH